MKDENEKNQDTENEYMEEFAYEYLWSDIYKFNRFIEPSK